MITPNTKMEVANLPKEKEVDFVPFGGDASIKLNITIIARYCAIPTKTGAAPTESDCVKFMMLCRARKLNPFEGDCFLLGYDTQDGPKFSLITAQQAYLKRAEVNPEYDGMMSGVIVKDDKGAIVEREGDFLFPGDDLLGGWARVHFKSRKIPTYRRLNLSTFVKPFGQWKANPAGMIVKCAEADALRSSFPTMLGGLYSEGEQEAINVSSTVTQANLGDAPAPRVLQAAPAAPAAAAKTPPKVTAKAPEPPNVVAPTTAPEPEPEPEPVRAPISEEAAAEAALGLAPEPSAPAAETAPFDPTETEAYRALKLLVDKSGVTIPQVMKFCQDSKIAKPDQTDIRQLADQKLQNLAKAWNNILPKIKAVKS